MSKRTIDSLVADIASDVPVDWDAVEGSQQEVQQFRIIAAVGSPRPRPESDRRIQALFVLLTMASFCALARVITSTVDMATTAPFRIGPRAFVALLFAVAGSVLLFGARQDRRTGTLGALFLLMASPFVQTYLIRASNGAMKDVAALVIGLSPEAFLAAALWTFAWVFPRPPRRLKERRIGIGGIAASVCLGLVLAVSNALAAAGVREPALVGSLALQTFERMPPATLSWPLLFAFAVPAFPYLLWKSLSGTVEDRNRVGFMAMATVVSLAPIVLAVMISPFLPAFGRQDVQTYVGLGLTLALTSLVPSTIYAVLVKKILNVHLALRRAVQHALARQIVWSFILGSLAYVAVSLYYARDRALGELVSSQVGLITISALGLASLTFRSQLLKGVDRWFERGTADYSEVLARLAKRLALHRNIRELHASLEDELVKTLHAGRVAIVVVDDDSSHFVSLDGRVQPLETSSAIAALFKSSRVELCLGGEAPDPLAEFLPIPERQWLAGMNVEWVFPLFSSSEELLGLLCLGEGRGPSYSKRDRVLVSAMSDQVALRMENLSLRRWPADGANDGVALTSTLDWQNEQAMQCPECSLVFAANMTNCSCGRRLQPAALPQVLNGKFDVERVLGIGGMGVVYLALDKVLQRQVAIKAMPKVTPNYVARLQREARVMATVRHPNLAMIYGAERWRDVPLLIVEYLDGGTLLDGLRGGPMAIDEALDLGIDVADALDRMHAANLLHRDIKPSNIGYTADGLPKLLDFGLAAVLNPREEERPLVTSERQALRAAVLSGTWSGSASRTLTQQLVGTPLYLSPEALALDEPDPSFDLWSLGVVLYEAIAGRHPFAGLPTEEVMRRTRSVRVPDVRDFRPDCAAEIAAFLNDTLSLSGDRRPQTAGDVRKKLQEIRRPFADSQHSPSRRLY